MISYISGKIIDIEYGKCLILTNSGLGYEININDLTFNQLEIGIIKEFFIYHHITDVGQSLFGFLEKEEKQIFLEFMKVSGVGGRSALNVLDLGISQIYKAFLDGDKDFFGNAKGIGKKTSEKIFVELKDKDFVKDLNILSKTSQISNVFDKVNSKQIKDALASLGYNVNRVEEILKTIPEDIIEIGDIINYIIKNIK